MPDHQLHQLILLREEGRARQDQALLAEVRARLSELLAEHSDHAQINYQLAIAHDNSGLGKEAIPYYERALQLGLSGSDRERCLLGLGSTYRYWGRYEQAIGTLRRGVQEFPDNRALKVYLAMALYNGNQAKESVALLLATLMEDTADEKLLYFKRGIMSYAEDLDEKAE